MKPKISILACLVLLTGISVYCALFLQPQWNASSLPLTEAPYQLREILSQDGADLLDLRRFEPGSKLHDGGFIWRIRLKKEIVASHTERFILTSAEADDENRALLLKHLPEEWGKFDAKELQWSANKFNYHEDGNLGHWYTMAICRETEMLLFIYSNWDYTP